MAMPGTGRTNESSRGVRLTPTEVKVLSLIAQGHSSKEAADRLVVSKRTVDFHLANIYDKLQVNNRLRLAVMEQHVPRVREREWDTTKPNRALARRLVEAQIPYKDLLDDLRQAARDEPVYRPRDSHWNQAGNRVAALALVPWVWSKIPAM